MFDSSIVDDRKAGGRLSLKRERSGEQSIASKRVKTNPKRGAPGVKRKAESQLGGASKVMRMSQQAGGSNKRKSESQGGGPSKKKKGVGFVTKSGKIVGFNVTGKRKAAMLAKRASGEAKCMINKATGRAVVEGSKMYKRLSKKA